jgi:glycosyltransferase involved in cell wall biosynthesis
MSTAGQLPADDLKMLAESSASHSVSQPALWGKHAGMIVFSSYPADPRPRRAIEALVTEGMSVDLICCGNGSEAPRECFRKLNITRVPIKRSRGTKLSYAYQYAVFILISAWMFAVRALRRRYDLVYVHNMPDVLVATALIPKLLGAKVILDQHDPMPELMMTIFDSDERSWSVRLLAWLEKWSVNRVDFVLTVNNACKRIFSSRSCPPGKIGVVMNSPDASIFPFHPARTSQHHDRNRPFTIMYHGSLVERNGLDLAIDALATARESIPAVELKIYGPSTPFLETVMEHVREQGLSECVHYIGPRRLEELAHEIAACDVGIIPNHRNPFTEINTPTRIFEYLAMGKPVIAPRTPGIQDYFADDTLFFFESGDARDLAEQLRRVHANPDRAVDLAEKGQQVYLSHLWNEESRNLVKMVSELLKGDR